MLALRENRAPRIRQRLELSADHLRQAGRSGTRLHLRLRKTSRAQPVSGPARFGARLWRTRRRACGIAHDHRFRQRLSRSSPVQPPLHRRFRQGRRAENRRSRRGHCPSFVRPISQLCANATSCRYFSRRIARSESIASQVKPCCRKPGKSFTSRTRMPAAFPATFAASITVARQSS